MNYNPIDWLSRLLIECGLTAYIERVELACHIFMGATFALIGLSLIGGDAPEWRYWLGHGIVAAYTLFMIYDELITDGHWRIIIGADLKWKDFIWDISSKLFAPIAYLVWILLR